MIDIHTHILPGIDDGAKDKEEALVMTENLFLQGVTAAICTPHFNPARMPLDTFLTNRKSAYNLLSDTKVNLIEGSETFLHEYLFHYNDLSQLCAGNTNYMLLELPFDHKWPSSILPSIEKLCYYYDIIPIIAHVERYPQISKNINTLKYLKDMGCLIQMNTTTIINKKHKNLVNSYLKYDYVDVLGSDCHNMISRPPIISEAREEITRRFGIDQWNRLCDTSKLIAGIKE
jgi:protein-tyrosine phosphatase